MAKYTLLKNIDGKTLRFYLDTAKAAQGELEKLKGRGWTFDPPKFAANAPQLTNLSVIRLTLS